MHLLSLKYQEHHLLPTPKHTQVLSDTVVRVRLNEPFDFDSVRNTQLYRCRDVGSTGEQHPEEVGTRVHFERFAEGSTSAENGL